MKTAASFNMPDSTHTGTGLIARLRGHSSALASLGVRILAAGLAYLLQIALARSLGLSDYGVYAFAWSIVAVGGYGATFGFSQTAVRFLARYAADGNAACAQTFIRFTLAVVVAGSTLLSGAAAVAFLASDASAAIVAVPVLIALAIIPFFALGDLAEGYARSQGWTILALTPPYLVRPALLLTALPVLWLADINLSATTALMAALTATALSALGQMAVTLMRLNRLNGDAAATRADSARWIRAAIPVFLADMAQVLRQNIDVLVLAAFVAPAEVAIYFAATRVAALLGLVEFAVGAAAAHRFARLDAKTAPAELACLAKEAAALTFWPTLMAAIVLCFAAPLVLSLFGTPYSAGSALVVVLAAASVVRAAIGPADDLLTMQGHGGLNMAAQSLGLAATCAFCLLLIPVFGIAGAALATLASTCITTIALALFSGRCLGIVPTPLPAALFARS